MPPARKAPWDVLHEKGIHFRGPPTRVHKHRINTRELLNRFESQAGASMKTMEHLVRIVKRKISLTEKAHAIMEEASLIAEQVKWTEAQTDLKKRSSVTENDPIWIDNYNKALRRAMTFIPNEEERHAVWREIVRQHKKDGKIYNPRKDKPSTAK